MYINSKRLSFILDDEENPETPEMPSMEKMMSGWQFDKKFTPRQSAVLRHAYRRLKVRLIAEA